MKNERPTIAPWPADLDKHRSSGPPPISELISDIQTALFRSRFWILLFVIVAILLAIVAGRVMTPKYTAVGRLVIDQSIDAPSSPQRGFNPLGDSMIIDSEVEGILSRDLLAIVGEQLHAQGIDADYTVAPDDDYVTQQEAIDALSNNLTVERVDSTFVVDIRFEAEAPDVAAEVVNSLMEEFRLQRQAVLVTYLGEAGSILEQQIEASDAEVAEAERLVEEFRAKTQVDGPANRGILEQELAEISEDFLRVQTILQELTQQIDAINAARDNPEAVTLERLALLAEETPLSAGPLQGIVRELQQLVVDDGSAARRAALAEEFSSQLAPFVARLEARRDEVQPTANALDRRRSFISDELLDFRTMQVELRGLERQARALEARHVALLTQLQETRQSSTTLNPVRVLQVAVPPLQPSSIGPKTLLIIAAFAGLMAGLGFALLREQLDRSFRSSRQLESITGTTFLGSIPKIKPRALKRIPASPNLDESKLKRRDKKELAMFSFASRFPNSRFAKTIDRTIFEVETKCPKPASVAILSAVGDEGKSLFTANLGFSFGARGRRVLMVDLDYKSLGLSDVIGKVGDVVETEFDEELEAAGTEYRSIAPNVHAICFNRGSVGNTTDLMPLLTKIQETQKEPFDVTVLDTPPIAYLPESLAFAQMSDAAVMVVQWGKTPRSLVSRLLSQNRAATTSLIGAVLSQTDPAMFDRYEHLPNSNNYYVEP